MDLLFNQYQVIKIDNLYENEFNVEKTDLTFLGREDKA